MKISVISQNLHPIESVTVEPLKVGGQIPLASSYQEILKDPQLYREQELTLIGKIDPSPTKNHYIASVEVFPEDKKVHVLFINGIGKQEITFDETSRAWRSFSEIKDRTKLIDWFSTYVIGKVDVDKTLLQPIRVTSWSPDQIDEDIATFREVRSKELEKETPNMKLVNALSLRIDQLKEMKAMVTNFNGVAQEFFDRFDQTDPSKLNGETWHYFKTTVVYLNYVASSLKGSIDIDPKVETRIQIINKLLDLLR